MTAPTRRAPALLRSVAEHFTKLSQRSHVDRALNDADATQHAARALADAGFQVTEEPFTRKAYRRFNRWAVTGLWALGGAAAFTIAHFAGLDLEFSISAAFGFTYLFDQWLPRARVDVESTNVIATRGKPRAWLVAHLDSQDDSHVRIAGVEEALLVAVLLVAMLLETPKPIFKLLAYAVLVFLLVRGILRTTFRAKSRAAVSPLTGAAAVLGAVEALGSAQDIGVLLTRGQDVERSGINTGLERRTKAPVLLIDSVGGPGRLEMIGSGESPLAIAVDIERAASEEDLPLAIIEAKRAKNLMALPFERVDRVGIVLGRGRAPDIFRHLRVLLSSRRQPDAVLDPVGQIAVVSRLLVRVVEHNSKDSQ